MKWVMCRFAPAVVLLEQLQVSQCEKVLQQSQVLYLALVMVNLEESQP